jgi:hypothetical protein
MKIANDVYFYDDAVVVETHRGPYKDHAIWHIPTPKAKKLGYFSSFTASDALDYYPNAHFEQMGWQRIG